MATIYSMTGYSRAEGNVGDSRLLVEAKSVNHRYLDLKLHLPREFLIIESKINRLSRSLFSRGRIEVWVTSEQGEKPVEVRWNRPLAEGILQAIKEMKEALELSDEPVISLLTREKDVILISDRSSPGEEVWPELSPIFIECFESLKKMRAKEGEVLARDILLRIKNIETRIDDLAQKAEAVVTTYRDRLEKRIKGLLNDQAIIDPERLAQEAAIFADRSDITEEMVRSRSHMAQVREVLEEDGAKGRKLDFLIQEMFREITTTSNKALDATVSLQVVEIKAELEKIREQVQNLE